MSMGTADSQQPLPVEVVDPFDTFWTAYCRKVGKPAARKAWNQLMKHKLATPEQIMEGLHPWLTYWAARNEPEYVPHPSTWLNQHRFNDEPPPAPGPKWGKGGTQSALERLAALTEAPDVFGTRRTAIQEGPDHDAS